MLKRKNNVTATQIHFSLFCVNNAHAAIDDIEQQMVYCCLSDHIVLSSLGTDRVAYFHQKL